MAGLYNEVHHEREMAKLRQEKDKYAADLVQFKKQFFDSEDQLMKLKSRVSDHKTTINELEERILELEQEKADLEDENTFQQTIVRRAWRIASNYPQITKGAEAAVFNNAKVCKVICKGLDGVRVGVSELADYKGRRKNQTYDDGETLLNEDDFLPDEDEEWDEYEDGERPVQGFSQQITQQALAQHARQEDGRMPGQPVCDGLKYIMSGANGNE